MQPTANPSGAETVNLAEMPRVDSLATLARKMMLTPAQAVALPLTIEVAARKLGWGEARMVAECFDNPRLAEYLASVCRSVTR